MKRLALVFLLVAASAVGSEAAKGNSSPAGCCDSAKAAKSVEENGTAANPKPDSRARSNSTPRRIPYHMLMIR